MCIFTHPVISVNNTQIFARQSGNGTQFLAYQMNYESRDQNAMILPIPVKQPARDEFLRFIDLKHYGKLFADLDDGFPFHKPPSIGCSASFNPASRADLEVFTVGNYIASFVPSLLDFDRLDSQFKLPTETWARIPDYKHFGFAVFQLAAGSLKPHPMAFEFQTDNVDLFFPTIHIHDGTVHGSEDFDHVLYLQHAGLDSKVFGYQNSHIEDESTRLIRSKYRASQFCEVNRTEGLVLGNLLLHRKIVRGNFPNVDTVFALQGDPIRPSLNLRPLLSYAPWLIIFASVGWFFNRRSKLKRKRESR
ncbi:MAG: hypothetical protein O2931_06520 [Planctomycetota bacterium]|nr:hypothetical protein [Planctomycetota bacterium]MDA1178433.1 hypothetical protein [Planctomycetota bacterium]